MFFKLSELFELDAHFFYLELFEQTKHTIRSYLSSPISIRIFRVLDSLFVSYFIAFIRVSNIRVSSNLGMFRDKSVSISPAVSLPRCEMSAKRPRLRQSSRFIPLLCRCVRARLVITTLHFAHRKDIPAYVHTLMYTMWSNIARYRPALSPFRAKVIMRESSNHAIRSRLSRWELCWLALKCAPFSCPSCRTSRNLLENTTRADTQLIPGRS